MKKITTALMVMGITFTSIAYSQDTTSASKELKEGVKTTGKAIGHGAKDVGHKTAEVTKKGVAAVADRKYVDKTGPNGETIYIDKHSKYYWIDKKGGKVYVSEAELKDKTK